MKSVHDHQGYREAAELLQNYQAKRDALASEQAEILAKLRWKEASEIALPTVGERAAAILNDQPLPANRAGLVEEMRTRELEIRSQAEVLDNVLRTQPSVVERQRDAARAAALGLRSKEIESIKNKWSAAQAALRDALAAENALIGDLLAGGFGQLPPTITDPGWLQRDWAVAELIGK